MCFNATSSLVAGAASYGVALYLHGRRNPRLKWAAVGLMGITAMQWAEGFIWLGNPRICGMINLLLTVGLIPLALLAQAWGPLLGSVYLIPVRKRRTSFYLLLLAGLAFVLICRFFYWTWYTQVTPQGYLNWWSPQNPPMYQGWAYSLWALIIGLPFLLWWRPFWQALLIVSWGWLWALLSFLFTDNAASNWCFFVSFYSIFLLVYALLIPDPDHAQRPNIPGA
jgi:hypothetical protein